MRAPEHVERAIEDRELIVTMHEERAAGVIDLVAQAEIDVLQRPVTSIRRPTCTSIPARRSSRPDDEITLEVGQASAASQQPSRAGPTPDTS